MTAQARPVPAATRKVTIYDVAQAAGVGRQTVSNVLNGSGRVGQDARERVLQAVAELGYQPHQGARSLRSLRTMQLGYLMPEVQLHPSNLIMMQFLQSLVTAGAEHGYRVVIAAHNGDPLGSVRRLVASRSVDAFVLSDPQPDDELAGLLDDLAVPYACFGRTGPDMPQCWADIDNAAAEAAAVRHLAERGYRRLAYLGYASGAYWDDEREHGFADGLASLRMVDQEAGRLLVGQASDPRPAIRGFLAAVRPDAVVTGSDNLAAIVYSVAAELDLAVGLELGVTGFDGSFGAGLLFPRLTGVVMPVEAIARAVIGRVLRQLDGTPDFEPGELIPAALRLGGSTAGPRARLARSLA